MSKQFCDLEPQVLEAANSASWEPSLRRHLDECPSCSDVALVAAFMKEADAEVADAAVPEGELVWWKAQLKARRAAAEKATRPIAVMEKLAFAGAGLALVVALAVLWPFVRSWGDWVSSNWSTGSQAAPVLAIGLASMVGLGAVLVLFALGMGLYFAWSDR